MNDSERFPLEPDAAGMREMTAEAGELIAGWISALGQRPASDTRLPADLAEEIRRAPPAGPEQLETLLERIRRAAEPSYETAGPSYLAYIPGGGVFAGALAEYLAAALNRYTGRAGPAPGFVALEESVLRWMCDLFEMPTGSQGLLTSGGSISNLTALAAARNRLAAGRSDRATVYVGEHAHGSLLKAARTIGIAPGHVRSIRSDADLRMDPEDLRRQIGKDRAAGLIPVCAVATGGTTNTGTIDPLGEVADAAADTGVWFHVDAAYGGFFRLTARGRKRLGGIERADSITLDPHKSLFLPFGTGALVVRDRDALTAAFSEKADYLQDLETDEALPDFDTLGPELTRSFRGLRLWLPLHLHGVDAFRRQLDEKLDLAERVHGELAADPLLEVPWTPDLTVVAFRLRGAGDEAQRRFLERINARQRILLSSTRLGGESWLRIAILSLRTHEDRIAEAVEIIREAAG